MDEAEMSQHMPCFNIYLAHTLPLLATMTISGDLSRMSLQALTIVRLENGQ